MPTEEKLVRITALLFRKEGTTPEEFYHHWYEIHGPKMLDLSLRYGVLEYRQVTSLVQTLYLLSFVLKHVCSIIPPQRQNQRWTQWPKPLERNAFRVMGWLKR